MSSTAQWVKDLTAVIYPIQFESDPLQGLERALRPILANEVPHLPPATLLESVRDALASDADLSQVLPQPHSDAKIRRFLQAVALRLTNELSGLSGTAADSLLQSVSAPGGGCRGAGGRRSRS